MIELKSGFGSWVVLSAAIAATVGAARPPVEAPRPRVPVEAVRPVPIEPQNDSPNSGGPGSPARENGTPAPAAETAKSADAKPKGLGGVWSSKPAATGEPKLLPPGIARDAKPANGKPGVLTPLAPAPIARSNDPLDARIDDAIELTARRVLVAESRNPAERTHTPWQIGHGMLALRQNYLVRVNGEKVSAFDWVAKNPTYRSQKPGESGRGAGTEVPWFYLTTHGARPQKYNGVMYEFEGHPNQFLAFFALARIPLDFEFTIEGKKVTYGQMLHNAKMEVTDREEVTWNLWAFAYHFDMNERWTNAAGEPWSMERLVETTQRQFSPTKSPCGGCHALFALASARNAYLQAGNRLTGSWTRAHHHLEQHVALAKAQQNRDGSFSSNYFKGPGYSNDPSKRISTSGHTLEFLMLALQQPRLKEPWVRNAVGAVARDLIQYQKEPIEVGGMYHAVHALVLYRERTRPELAARIREVAPASAEAEKPGGKEKK